MDDLISRKDTISAIMGEHPEAHYPDWYARIIEELPSARSKSDRNTGDLVERQAVLDLARDLTFKNIEGLKHYRYRCIDPDHVRELRSVQLAEAIPVAWIEDEIKDLRAKGNEIAPMLMFAILSAELEKWKERLRNDNS